MTDPRHRGGAHHPLIELTLARVREFIREPEAIFWTFGFPILISLALSVAFPSNTGRPVVVGIVAGATTEATRATLADVEGVSVREVPAGGEQRALREGDVHLIVEGANPPTYRFDPAREESRVARLVVDNALKRGAGRADPWEAREEPVSIAGDRKSGV